VKLLALIAALLINSRLPPGGWRSARGFFRYSAWLQPRLMRLRAWDHGLGVALVLLPPLLPVAILQWSLGGALFGGVGLVLSVAALCFAFGGGEPLEAEVAAFTAAWRRGDTAAAATALKALAGGRDEPMAFEAMPEAAAGHLMLRARTRLFAPVFWFVLLGPVGAFGYRLAVLARAFGDCQDNAGPGYCGRATRLVAGLDWLPDRLMALTLALAGHFSAAWTVWESEAAAGAPRRLAETGMAALGVPLANAPRDLTADAVDDAYALLRRTVYVWLALVAAGVLLIIG
jgi:AmpE protein